ncbi:MAG: murein L,D-transpeptidase catalytic domain family protein [Bacteroidetes bacterium]|nr:murein L,D-transpeptidase catalytic domain family protein [Bacteroidota bacterium]
MTIGTGFLLPIIWALTILGLSPSSTAEFPTSSPLEHAASIWQHLSKSYPDPPSLASMNLALQGYRAVKNDLENPLLTVIDFTRPSTQKRLWIIDVEKKQILLQTVVAHGKNSGLLMAEHFSNRPESHQSSLGFFKTAETYQGKHGASLRLDGLEKGINDMARSRAIVIHGADHAREEVAKIMGRLGRSFGCPAVPTEISSKLIQLIKEGSLLFIYGKNYPSIPQNPPPLVSK